MPVTPAAYRMRIRPVQRSSITGSYLGSCIFYQFLDLYLLSVFVVYASLAFASVLVYDIFL